MGAKAGKVRTLDVTGAPMRAWAEAALRREEERCGMRAVPAKLRDLEDETARGPWYEKLGFAEHGDWFIVRGAPRVACQRLGDLRALGIAPRVDFLCPVERRDVKSGRGDKKRALDLPLFGSYWFARASLARGGDPLRDAILDLDGVAGFVGVGPDGMPRPVPAGEATSFQQLLREPVVSAQKPRFSVKDAVRVLSGPFRGFDGAVHRVLGGLDERQRIAVLIAIFGRPTPVVVEAGQIEPLDRAG